MDTHHHLFATRGSLFAADSAAPTASPWPAIPSHPPRQLADALAQGAQNLAPFGLASRSEGARSPFAALPAPVGNPLGATAASIGAPQGLAGGQGGASWPFGPATERTQPASSPWAGLPWSSAAHPSAQLTPSTAPTAGTRGGGLRRPAQPIQWGPPALPALVTSQPGASTSPTLPQSLAPATPAGGAAAAAPAAPLIGCRLGNRDVCYVRRSGLHERAANTPLSAYLLGGSDVPRDEQGRVILDCHPARGVQIVEYLNCGAVPGEAGPELLAQARTYGLSQLVLRLEAGIAGVRFARVSNPATEHFQARFTFCGLADALARGQRPSLSVLDANNATWTVTASLEGVCIEAAQASGERRSPNGLAAAVRVSLQTQETAPEAPTLQAVIPASLRRSWAEAGYTLDELLSEPIGLHRGGVVAALEVKYVLPAAAETAAPSTNERTST